MKLIRTIAIAAALIIPSAAFAATSYSITNTAAAPVNEWGTCYQVTNNTGKNLFIPTNTSAEWSAFYSHLPSGVATSSCNCAASGACAASANGTVCTSYSASSATSPTLCSSLVVSSTCANGSWSVAPAANASCAQNYRSCAASGGCAATANGGTCTTYSSNAPSGAACSTVARTSTCNDGTWSVAPYTYGSCSSGCAASGACGAASNGGTCSTNSTSAVASPSTCPSNVTSTCSNGSWSPAPGAYSSCYAWYQSGFGACSSSCTASGTQSQTVYCQRNDGTQVADTYCTGTKPSSSQSCSSSSGCVHAQGSSCSLTSASNACGQTNTTTGTWNYDVCSAATPSVPANPSYYGGACTLTSGANSCGTSQTCPGTLNCSNVCTGTCNPPAIPGVQTCSACNGAGCNYGSTDSCGNNCNALLPYFCWSTPGGCTYGSTAGSAAGTNVCQVKDPSYYGQACTMTSAANICGATNSCPGTLNCANSCSGTCAAPANPPSYQACGTDGNVHTYNGCGTDQGVSQTCHYGCSNATCATGTCIGNGGSAGSYTSFTVTTGSLPTGYAYVGCSYQVYNTASFTTWNSRSSSGCSAQFNAGSIAGSTAAVTMICQ